MWQSIHTIIIILNRFTTGKNVFTKFVNPATKVAEKPIEDDGGYGDGGYEDDFEVNWMITMV